MTASMRRDGAIGYVTLDNPPVNAMGLAMRQALMQAVDWAESEPGLERVIVSGAGRAFAAGGDAREFDAAPVAPHLPDVFDRIEACKIPWIAAAHGVALGGGAELMLACRWRIGAPGLTLGLPEVTLGVIPGAGGTQRLPRLVGMTRALEMISSGKPVSAAEALAMGFLDAVAEDPLAAAAALPLSDRPAVSALPAPAADHASVEAARKAAQKKLRGQIAPLRAIDMVEMAATTPFAQALTAERAAFIELRNGPQSRALRHVFFAERAAGAPADVKSAAPSPLRSAAVVGGGTMGSGIAAALLGAGLRVTILETDAEGAERARANVNRILDDTFKRGLVSAEALEARRAAFSASHDYADAADADLAIEAAFESMEVKQTVFAALEGAMRPDAVLATNTSYLDVNVIAAGLRDPSRLIGLHFFAPAHVMKLLEIVRGEASSLTALATGFDLAKRLRKIPVLAGVCDGFIGNRILARYREAADTILMDGATPWEIDEAMRDYGYAMGLYETQDLSGLDIAYAARKRQAATRDPRRRYIPIADRMVEEGRLGRKTAVGWYRYPGGQQIIDPLIEDLVREEAHFAGVVRREFSADEIRRRLLLAMFNEAAGILEEGVALSAADIDLVTVHGYGFPRWRGGLMHAADAVGAAEILAGLRALEAEDPLVWRPSAVIVDCAARGLRLSEWRRG